MSEPLREVFSETFDVRDLCVPTVEEYTASVAGRLCERAADKGRDWLWEDCRLNAEIRTEARQDGSIVTVSVTLESFGLPHRPLLAPRAGLLPAGRLAEILARADAARSPLGLPWPEGNAVIAEMMKLADEDVPALLAHIATLEKVIADCGADGLLAVREAGRREGRRAGLEEAERIVRVDAEEARIRGWNDRAPMRLDMVANAIAAARGD
jgi:hypothetical protein